MEESVGNMAGSDGIRRDGVATHAGFPNPAADRDSAPALSLDQLLVTHPSSTYFFRIDGDMWAEQGIFDGDIALIDRALDPRPADLIACWRDGAFAITRFSQLEEGEEMWGIISTIIHQYRRREI